MGVEYVQYIDNDDVIYNTPQSKHIIYTEAQNDLPWLSPSQVPAAIYCVCIRACVRVCVMRCMSYSGAILVTSPLT